MNQISTMGCVHLLKVVQCDYKYQNMTKQMEERQWMPRQNRHGNTSKH